MVAWRWFSGIHQFNREAASSLFSRGYSGRFDKSGSMLLGSVARPSLRLSIRKTKTIAAARISNIIMMTIAPAELFVPAVLKFAVVAAPVVP